MMQPPSSRKFCVLAAEDDANDVLLLQMGLERSGLDLDLIIAHDGQEAIDFLSGVPLPDQPGSPTQPDLFLLDISMPRLSGVEVLKWLRDRPQFRTMPVVVLSFSLMESERKEVLSLGASAFLDKPRSVEGLVSMWLGFYARYLSVKAK